LEKIFKKFKELKNPSLFERFIKLDAVVIHKVEQIPIAIFPVSGWIHSAFLDALADFIKKTDMEKKNFSEMTDEQLFLEKKKQKNAKIFHAVFIGFLAGILIFGMVSWSLSSEKRLGFLLPMLIPVFILYKLLRKPK
jgi:hypothetical protein